MSDKMSHLPSAGKKLNEKSSGPALERQHTDAGTRAIGHRNAAAGALSWTAFTRSRYCDWGRCIVSF